MGACMPNDRMEEGSGSIESTVGRWSCNCVRDNESRAESTPSSGSDRNRGHRTSSQRSTHVGGSWQDERRHRSQISIR